MSNEIPSEYKYKSCPCGRGDSHLCNVQGHNRSRQFTLVLTSADGQTDQRFECEAETSFDALLKFAGLWEEYCDYDDCAISRVHIRNMPVCSYPRPLRADACDENPENGGSDE